MNPFIEYALRVNLLQNALKLPCSLFANRCDGTKMEKLVITLHKEFGEKETILVKHWMINECKKSEILPSFKEYRIKEKDILASDHVIVSKYRLLDYYPEFYPLGQRQTSDLPLGPVQEKKYKECMEEFFYAKKHRLLRTEWLWEAFMRAFLSKSFDTVFANHHTKSQQAVISDNFPIIWKGWQMWTKYLLADEVEAIAAPELLFSQAYEKKLKKDGLWTEGPTPYETFAAPIPDEGIGGFNNGGGFHEVNFQNGGSIEELT